MLRFFRPCSLMLALLVPAVEAAAADPTSEELAEWVKQLDSDKFLTRERASQQLIAAGLPAIEALERRLDPRSPEAVARGVAVLRQLALASEVDLDVAAAATEALQRMAEGNDSPLARHSRSQLYKLAAQREERALQRLMALGMEASLQHMALGGSYDAVHFGDDWKVADRDLSLLRWLGNIEEVSITFPEANDQWMKHVAQMPRLSRLAIKRTRITDAGLKELPEGPLQLLELKYVNITDGAVSHLKKIVSLRLVRAYGTKISLEGADELRQGLALAEVDHRDGAFLGVSCTGHPLGCRITLVSPGTAAQKCGLQLGDVVVEYCGNSVADFEKLTKFISRNKVGDEVTLVYVRDALTFDFQVEVPQGSKSGLSVKPHRLGLLVTDVDDDSPLQGRIRDDDIVVKVNDARVDTLPKLEAALNSDDRAAMATIVVARGGQVFERTATLGEWE